MLLVNLGHVLKICPLNARHRSLDAAINACNMNVTWDVKGSTMSSESPPDLPDLLRPLVSLLLYLCSEAAGIGDERHAPAKPVGRKVKTGVKMFAPTNQRQGMSARGWVRR